MQVMTIRFSAALIPPAMLAASALAVPSTVLAASVTIDVRGPDGRPLPGAVVSVESPRGGTPVVRGPYVVEQRDITFQPDVLIVPVGASVVFPNRDKVRHHVYSFSKARKFDLKLYGREDARSIVFDKAGVVTLGCNIHDRMNGAIYVTASPFTVRTDAAGRAALSGVPTGPVTIRVWHPSIRAAGNVLSQTASVAATGLSTTYAIRR
ncbi:methylamine utilization protein [Sphingomonas sp. Leaf17]|uniref:methylamine utilization protein n=1 Tax=Sphingomonas sp. Leaf17 TaxID=1735683 RepID=UPI000A4A89FA|nr:methylamine utilization protein [Sphingomonas sp. Leaf17]